MDKKNFKILIACEFSGIVREAFIKLGFTNTMSCDLLDTEIKGNHYKGDVLDMLNENWDLIIAHPPCTYLCNSGVRWLHEKKGRWDLMREGARFFKKLLDCKAKHVAVENPVIHKYAVEIIGRKHDFTIQPYEFGEPESKCTCFWVKNLLKLKPTKVLKEYNHSVHTASPSIDRWKFRSRTFRGVAKAMADQWGNFVVNEKVDKYQKGIRYANC